METAGHIIGFIAVACFCVSYLLREKRALLILQTAGTALLCIQYLLIGATTGFALNAIGTCRNICYALREKGYFKSLFFPIAFAVIMAAVSIFFYEGPHSLLIIIGLITNTICLGVCSAQGLRISVLFTCSMLIVYNIFVASIGGLLNESISIIAAIIGIIHYRKDHGRKPPSVH